MSTPQIEFIAHDPSFQKITGSDPSSKLLAEDPNGRPMYHEACIYDARTKSVYVTSNQIKADTQTEKHVVLTRIDLHGYQPSSLPSKSVQVSDVTENTFYKSCMNGGVNYNDDHILMCVQGSKNPSDPSGLWVCPVNGKGELREIISTFHGAPFNSVNDVVIHPEDGSIWFTDPCYGYHQEIRPKPQLPNQVYRFDPKTKSIRAVADGFTRPNGICFSPNLKIVYITDTGAIHGSSEVPIDPAGPSHIYAFDVVDGFLVNRRLFAYAPGRFPDGIKCDMNGNVYSGCGDGVEVWNNQGTLIGIINCEGGVANFCFGESGAMFLCNESRFWMVQLDGNQVKGALLGL